MMADGAECVSSELQSDMCNLQHIIGGLSAPSDSRAFLCAMRMLLNMHGLSNYSPRTLNYVALRPSCKRNGFTYSCTCTCKLNLNKILEMFS